MIETDIRASVGDRGANDASDVAAVQGLLNSKGFKAGKVDGVCGPKTVAAIQAFQATFTRKPDGLIEPRRTSWIQLTGVLTVLGTPSLVAWSGDSSRWSHEKKLRSMQSQLRPKVSAVLAGLSARGFQPKIFFAWRSVAVQLDIVKKGHSSVKFSFHNVQRPDGTPTAYAADIVDVRWAWGSQAATAGFWRALGEEAKKQNLYWGGDWTKPDVAHVQLVPNTMLGHLKRESGL